MSVRLRFNPADTLELAEHALAAPHAQQTFAERFDGVACPRAVMWVKDHGVYLMSGGVPGLLVDPIDPRSGHKVVYAEGCQPGADHDELAAELGGDDFVEHLHLREGDPPLIDLIRHAHRRGWRWLVLTARADTFDITFAR